MFENGQDWAEEKIKTGFLPIKKEYLSTVEDDCTRTIAGRTIKGEEQGVTVDSITIDRNDRKQKKEMNAKTGLRSNGGLRDSKSIKARKREKREMKKRDLCQFVSKGEKCLFERCEYVHDVEEYLRAERRRGMIGDERSRSGAAICFGEERKCPYECARNDLKCPFGVRCWFYDRHENDRDVAKDSKSLIEWRRSEGSCEFNALGDDLQKKLRESAYDLPRSTKYLESVGTDILCVSKTKKRKMIARQPSERYDKDETGDDDEKVNKIDFDKKLILAPLTTVGHAPFRRLCVKLGADITMSEMAMASNLLAGDRREWALLRRHKSESSGTNKFGVQICAGYPDLVARCVELIENEVKCDFIDINMGCPIEGVCAKGAGSSLLTQLKSGKLEKIIDAASSSLCKIPLTIKIRMGYHDRQQQWNAHQIVDRAKNDWLGKVAAITLHGRTRAQRYSRLANWEYIDECGRIASNGKLPLIGNGDVYTYEDYNAHMMSGNISTCMIGRGAIIKPWLFKEIKEQRHIDISSSERLDYFADFCNYGLEHWGSDSIGVDKTRTFLCEWMSYTHRYVPVGLLEHASYQKMHLRPQRYYGRNDMETLLSSDAVEDWIKLSEMFLGKPSANWNFAAKHKSNSYVNVGVQEELTSWEDVEAQG